MIKFKKKNELGFTLLELLVSMTVFTVVFTISAGAVISIIDANRKAQALKSVMNNLNLAMESMTIDLRFGTTYHCGNNLSAFQSSSADCVSGGNSISFYNRNGIGRVYYLKGGRIWRNDNGGVELPVTVKEMTVEKLDFYVTGSTGSDNIQPKVQIVLQGKAGKKKAETSFSLQTSVSQRELDL